MFCPTLTLFHEFINISASFAGTRYYVSVWSPGCTTFENQDASKIGSEGRMWIPNQPAVGIPEVEPVFPFVSFVLVDYCSVDGWCYLARRRKMESRVFRPSPLPAHKPAWAWGTFDIWSLFVECWLKYRRGIEGPAMSWISAERIAVRKNLPHNSLWLCE
jgi:hypothetical protein